MAIRDRIMSLNMRQPFREDVLRPMPMPMPILPPAPRQPLPLPMLPPIMPPRREDFLSIERLDDPIERPLPVGPSIPFVPPPQPPVTLPVSPVQARRQELENLGYDAADVQEILERDQVRGLGNVTSNVLPSIPCLLYTSDAADE